jgi:hypothetical protein
MIIILLHFQKWLGTHITKGDWGKHYLKTQSTMDFINHNIQLYYQIKYNILILFVFYNIEVYTS